MLYKLNDRQNEQTVQFWDFFKELWPLKISTAIYIYIDKKHTHKMVFGMFFPLVRKKTSYESKITPKCQNWPVHEKTLPAVSWIKTYFIIKKKAIEVNLYLNHYDADDSCPGDGLL